MNIKNIVFANILCLYSICGISQNINLNNKIPADATVKMGTLSNGLKYYIKHNAKPQNKAEFRLVIKAGSILEDDDQQGLAHFVEHMAFNGTESFEKNKLIDYLQGLGVEFGADLNAHTSLMKPFINYLYQPIPKHLIPVCKF